MSEETEQLEIPGTEPETPAVDPKFVELQAKYDRIAGLERYVEALGSTDALVELATIGNQVRQNPTIQEAIKQALGQKPAPEPELEIYDPEIKALNDRLDPALKALQEQNARLESQLNEITVERYREKVSSHMGDVLKPFASHPELLREATETLNSALKSASQDQLEALHQPSGVKTMKMMIVDQIEKLGDVKRVSEPTEASILSKATDARPTTRAALPANTVGVKSGTKITPRITQDILEQVTAKLGKDPKTFWN
jgi:hypothetical protein